LFLIEIDRGGTAIGPVAPDQVIAAQDRLVFTGVVTSIIELEKIAGLVPAADPSYEVSPHQQRRRRLCEAVISENSPLVGKTIRDADFRASYGAAVVAVHRGGTRVGKKVGDIRIRPGDTLLLQTGAHFLRAHRYDPAFYLISDVDEWRPVRRDRAWIAVLLFLVLVVLMTTGVVSTLVACLLIAVLMVAVGCLSAGDARRSIEWQVLLTIASSFGVGIALEKTGAATAVAQAIVDGTERLGPTLGVYAALACIYLAGSIITEMITNNAAAVLLFPFCLKTAVLYEASPRPFLMALVLAASASFITPIGYQTNMMVYGVGGYQFGDFFKIGGLLHVILFCIAVVLIPIIWPFFP
jgi:di/tricarboxylate transporter